MRTKFWSKNPTDGNQLEEFFRGVGDNIRMDVRETEWEGVDWIHLPQHRYLWQAAVNRVMNLRVP
jgi:hypothetical protein